MSLAAASIICAALLRPLSISRSAAATTAAPASCGAAFGDPLICGEMQRISEVLREIAAVVGLIEWRRIRHRARWDRVAAAQFGGIDPELARRLVDDRFDDIDRLGPAAAAIGRGGHRVG